MPREIFLYLFHKQNLVLVIPFGLFQRIFLSSSGLLKYSSK